MFTTLSDKIKTVLIANDNIQEVWDFEQDKFNGLPAVVIVPSNNEADYNTSNQNERIYAFVIRCFISRTLEGAEVAEKNTRDLVGSIIDDFDKDYLFSGLVVSTGYTFINVFAAPTAWGYSGEDDEYRVAEVTLRCRVIVDVTDIN